MGTLINEATGLDSFWAMLAACASASEPLYRISGFVNSGLHGDHIFRNHLFSLLRQGSWSNGNQQAKSEKALIWYAHEQIIN
jgi:hypothetical protein